jgi:hypothetical protein
MTTNTNAISAVLAIIDDIKDRRGFKALWYDLDDDVREEITEAWINIVNEAINASK